MNIKRCIWIVASLIISASAGYHMGYALVPQEASISYALIDEPLELETRVKVADCVMRGSLPDPECTPGAIFPGASKEQICVPGYTKIVRKVSQSLRKKVFREYNVPYPPARGEYEADHFIPLALGGSNDIANLFPEPAEPKPGFHEKDMVEVYLYEEVCAGRVGLSAAQRAIAINWLDVYRSISPSKLNYLRQKYHSWDN